jgi:hypothetical protein
VDDLRTAREMDAELAGRLGEPEPLTIELRLIEHGELVVQVDGDEYEQAKRDGELDQFLDAWASDIDTSYVVVEPGGVLVEPETPEETRLTLLGHRPTLAMAEIIGGARADEACDECDTGRINSSGRPCPWHIAEHLIAVVRQESLLIIPTDQADAMLRRAFRDGQEARAAARRPLRR